MTLVATRPKNGVTPIKSNTNRARVDPLQMVLFPARAFLALGWIRAGVEKLIDSAWWNGDMIRSFLDAHESGRLPFLDVVDDFIGPRIAIVVAVFVLLAEFGIGLCLITARRLPLALTAACALNFAFVAFGAVNPSAFYLILQLTLLLAMYVQRPVRSVKSEIIAAGLCVTAALAVAPFIRTIEPHGVIEDPAAMVATLALLMAATLTILTVEARPVKP